MPDGVPRGVGHRAWSVCAHGPIGFLAGVAALIIRFGFGIGFRPLLNLIETMVITGTLLFGFGFVGELIAGLREEQNELGRQLERLTPPGQD